MGMLIAVIVIAVVAAAVVIVLVRRRRTAVPTPVAEEPPAPRPTAPAPPSPMTDLESALARVTDRSGRPIRERIDAESAHVDELRDPDDTGPLLRRALDSVSHDHGATPPGTSPAEPADDDPDRGPAGA